MTFKSTQSVLKWTLVAASAALLYACGGGGGSTTATPATSVAPPLLSVGTITGFGSVVVNGVRFDDSVANVAFDDADDVVGTDNKGMQLGMDAEVKGKVNDDKVSGEASEVHIESMVRGPAATVTPAATGNGGTVDAMGVHIVADDTTMFFNITKVADLKAGDIVNVHGPLNADGSVQAKFLEKRATSKTFKTVGKTASSSATSFKIGALSVSYDATTKLRNLPNGISDGILVRVSGASADYNATSNTLKASKVKAVTPFVDHDMNEGEVRGPVADLSTDKLSFTINGAKVTVDANTVYKNGTAADLANTVIVEAEGSVTAGVLLAKTIEFMKPHTEFHELHGAITGLTATTTPAGFSFTVHGQKVQTDGSTVFKLRTATALAEGMKVEVDGTSVVNGVLTATKVTEDNH